MSTRREFLKKAGILGAALAIPRSVFATPQAVASAAEAASETAEEQLSYTINLGPAKGNIPPKRTITIPDVGEFKVLKGDFHIHTIFSDGAVWPAERVNEAVGNGLDVISITDHIEYRPNVGGNGLKLRELNDEYNITYNYAKPVADRAGLLLIRGTEITKSTMPPGHFNALFIDDINPIAAVQSDIRKMFEETKKQGGFIFWNHPGWQAPKSGGIEPGAPIKFTEVHEDFYKNGWIDGIETFNGSEFYPIVPEWIEKKELAIFANSDIHRPEFDTYGPRNTKRPITLVLAKEKTLESIKEAFFAKRTVAWFADRIAGRAKWLEPLCRASLGINKEGGKIELVNKSDLPFEIEYGMQKASIPAKGKAELKSEADILVVKNWLIGLGKSLEINV